MFKFSSEDNYSDISNNLKGYYNILYYQDIFQSSSVKKFSPKKSSIYAGILED